jgi:hypothetical protein
MKISGSSGSSITSAGRGLHLLSKSDHKNNKIIFVIIILVIFMSIAKYYSEKQKSNSGQRTRSLPTTYDTGSEGYKAVFLLFEKMGYAAGRFEKDIEMAEDIQDMSLIIVHPYFKHLDEEYAIKLYRWVRKGNNLIVIDQADSPLWKLLGVTCKISGFSPQKDIQISDNTGIMSNVKTLGPIGLWRFKLPDTDKSFEIHLQDEQGVICASKTVGRGRITIFSSPFTFSNSNIDKNDNVILITNLAASAGNSRIYFDEYLHGYGYGAKNFTFPPASEAVFWQFGVMLFLFYACLLIRFGKFNPLAFGNIRITTEYIYSLGNLFRKAQANNFVFKNLLRNFQRRTKIRTGPSGEKSIEKIAGVSESFDDDLKGKIALIIEKSKEIKDAKSISDSNLLEFSHELEYIINKLNKKKISRKRREIAIDKSN